jgi:hypothetical protein
VSCNPAVPPPPVTGAALGTGLVDEAAGAAAVLVTVDVAVAVLGAGELELTPGVPDATVLPDEGELPDEADAVTDPVGEMVTDGEKTVGVEDEDEVHAETATGASRVRAPQHMAVSLALSGVPVIVLRTFIDPPHAPGR